MPLDLPPTVLVEHAAPALEVHVQVAAGHDEAAVAAAVERHLDLTLDVHLDGGAGCR